MINRQKKKSKTANTATKKLFIIANVIGSRCIKEVEWLYQQALTLQIYSIPNQNQDVSNANSAMLSEEVLQYAKRREDTPEGVELRSKTLTVTVAVLDSTKIT